MSRKGSGKDGQRVDTWLWHARFFKTRSLATSVVLAGKVRLSRDSETSRIEKPATQIRAGDELTFAKGRAIKVIRVVALSTRRGPAPEAQELYEDLSPPPPPPKGSPLRDRGLREAGAGRPTKKERRAIDKLRGLDQGSDYDV